MPADRIRFSLLDFKLGARMLARYPGLTLVGGLAMAFAIWVGAGTFEFLNQVVNPTLPFRNGDRIVALRNLDIESRDVEGRALYDLSVWRRELRSVKDIGAWRQLDRNLIVAGGPGEPVALAEISASAFRLTGVPPLFGRALMDADESPDVPPVVVLGHDLWRVRFAGDSGIIGRSIRLGATLSTVVGVMPPGFAFPVAHDMWVPFRLDPAEYQPRQGPGITIFGRLADGATIASASRELELLGQRAALDSRETHEHLRPQILPYAKSFFNVQGAASLGVMSSNLLLVLLLGLICLNVALLIYARTATRESEIVVRTALGASRARIVSQLFAEAMVLAGVAAVVGLTAASFGLQWAFDTVIQELLDGARLPFWFHSHLSASTVIYALLLAVIAAVVAGVLPALKVTRGLGLRLKTATAGGGGLQFGGIWTAVIVAQVALTTVFPVIAFEVRRDSEKLRNYDLNFPAERFLVARVAMDRESPLAPDDTSVATFRKRFASSFATLEQQLEAQPGVMAVTYVDHLPRSYHGWNQIEVDEGAIAPRDARGHRVSAANIDIDYFEALGTPLLSGRGFHAGDLPDEARTVIVNEPFVQSVLGGKNPIGRRLRYVAGESSRSPADPSQAPWYEIVGVVPDLGTVNGYGRAGIYHPAPKDRAGHLVMRVSGDPSTFVPVLRSVATTVDPTLRLYSVMPMSAVANSEIEFYRFWFRLTLGVSGVALLLSLAGIYAVLAFTVSRRTREIGIRVALGSDSRRTVAAIFRRPLLQVVGGVAVGALFVALLFTLGRGALPTALQFARIGAYGVGMTLVCFLACIVPTRRALRIEPTEALRMEG
ncbi:MAG TPA: ABC transporter permease [Gemmatimonadaceae bacterium]|nr:ABC transporter permease [Gemmatimonadaceae bacterium]